MRFYSWNVNGFRSVLKKGFMDWLEEAEPDVLSLQEIRSEWEEVDLGVRRQIESASRTMVIVTNRRLGRPNGRLGVTV